MLLLTILFLGAGRPLPNTGALALGYFATCAVIGVSALILFGEAGSGVSTVGQVISTTVGVLLIVLGLRSLLNDSSADTQSKSAEEVWSFKWHANNYWHGGRVTAR